MKKTRKRRELKPGEPTYIAESVKPGISKVEAARRAGLEYVPHGAHIQKYRAELIARQMQLADITTERTLLEIGRIAYFDPRRMFDKHGNMIPITEMDDDTAAAVAGFEVEKRYEGKGEDAVEYYVLKPKIASKVAALDLLTRLDLEAQKAGKGGAMQSAPQVHVHFAAAPEHGRLSE